jgi:uncharacterized protein (TIGR03435 family)
MPLVAIKFPALRRICCCLALALLSIPQAFVPSANAQAPPPVQPSSDAGLKFEVATIKPNNSKSQRPVGVNIYAGGRIEIIGVSLKALTSIALQSSSWQITGGGDWTEKALFDVEAEPAEDQRASFTNLRHSWYGIEDARLRAMLAALLADRFRLQFHRDSKPGTVYWLEQSKKPIKLLPEKEAPASDNSRQIEPLSGQIEFTDGRWYLFDTSMSQFATFTSNYVLHCPVLDHTELTGNFHYKSPSQVVPTSQHEQFVDSFLSLVPELGLKLTKQKGSVEHIVIDHAEEPSAN